MAEKKRGKSPREGFIVNNAGEETNSKTKKDELVLDAKLSLKLKGFIDQLKKEQKINDDILKKVFSDEILKSDIVKPSPDSLPVYIFDNANLSALEAIVKYFREEMGYSNKKIALALNRNEKTVWATYRNAAKKQPERFKEPSDDSMQKNVLPEHYFRLHNGQQLKSFDELLQSVSLMDDDVFGKYVNNQKNDFCNWIRDVFLDVRMAEKLSKARKVKDFLKIAKQQLGIKKMVKELKTIWIPSNILVAREKSVLESIVDYLKENKNLTLHQIAVLLNRDDRTIWTVQNRAKIKNEA